LVATLRRLSCYLLFSRHIRTCRSRCHSFVHCACQSQQSLFKNSMPAGSNTTERRKRPRIISRDSNRFPSKIRVWEEQDSQPPCSSSVGELQLDGSAQRLSDCSWEEQRDLVVSVSHLISSSLLFAPPSSTSHKPPCVVLSP
jgi:hypothetical protein